MDLPLSWQYRCGLRPGRNLERQVVRRLRIVDLELDREDDLLGLYQGQSLLEDSFFAVGGTEPPKISIYRGPILRQCERPEAVVQAVYDTVVHELGHHVGLDDDEMPY